MIYLLLFVEFVKIGIFSLGGGYATLPFLYSMSEVYGWFSPVELTQMLALSSITPGPVGINVATYAGFKTAGLAGSIIATNAVMIPPFIMIIVISKMLNKFKDSPILKSVLYALRPATAAMIASVGLKLFFDVVVRSKDFSKFDFSLILSFFDIKALFLILVLLIISLKLKRDPLIYLAFGALAGILLHLGDVF